MAAANYSPPAEALIKATRADFDRRDVVQPVHLVQYDDTLPVLAVTLYKGGQPWALPTGADVNLRMDKKDGHYVYNPALGVSSDRSTVYMAVTAQMTTGYGTFAPVVEVLAGGGVAGMAALRLDIDKNPVQDGMLESTDEYKAVQTLAAEVAANAKIVRDNEAGIQDVHDNIEAIKAAPSNAKAAAASAKEARSWAVGDTASRPGEGMNNAKYYAEQAQSVAQGQIGWYATPQALRSAHPTGQNGQWAIIGTTDTIWTWDSDTSAWVDSGAQVDLSNYPTNEQLQQTLSNYPTNEQLQQSLQKYPTTSKVQDMIASVAPQVMTKEFVIKNTVTNASYAEYNQAISVSGYTPVSVGYRCRNAELNVYGCCLRNGMAFVGFTNVKLTNLVSGMSVTLVVTYIKTS